MTDAASVTRSAAGMGIATAVSRVFGFARVLAIAAILGTTYLGNTFTSSNYVSNVLFELLAAGALSAVLVPTMVELLDRGDTAEAERLAGGVLGRALVGLGVVTVGGVVAAPLIARVLVSAVPNHAVAAQQERLASFLLRFFIPQVLLYAIGTVAIAVLYAKRRFVITALAPIGNTVMIVAGLLVFRLLNGPGPPGLDLSLTEKLALAVGGTLGVGAFIAVPAIALWRSGFRLVPRVQRRDPPVTRLLRLSAWAVLQHAEVGLLLGVAIVLGNAVRGGTVAYQFAFVIFLAPYAVLAQPIHTAILPELARETTRADRLAFAGSLRWALDSMAVLVVPVSALTIALAQPAMSVVAFGEARAGGVGILAAGVASLALGLFPYSAFLLLARAYYALGDSRTPSLVALATALGGAGVMLGLAPFTHGSARVGALGIGHSVAYGLGFAALAIGLSRRTGHAVAPTALLRALVLSVALGVVVWWVAERVTPDARAGQAALVAGLGAAAVVVYVGALRVTGGRLGARLEAIAGQGEAVHAPDPAPLTFAPVPDGADVDA